MGIKSEITEMMCVLNDTALGFTDQQFMQAQRLITLHDRIIICSMGKPAFACAKAVYTARSFGLDWHELDATHAFHGDAGIVKQGDLIIIVSKSGETNESVDVALRFQEWDTLSITSEENCRLNNICKYNLIIPIEKECSPFGYAPMASTTIYMIVLHAMLSYAVEAQGCSFEDYAKNHTSGQIGRAIFKENKK